MNIGIFGGTFDPPHMGHIAIVSQAIRQLSLDKVIVFPCGVPPHKHTDTSMQHRADMTRMAFDGMPVEVDDYELHKQGKSYTVDTVRYVKSCYPNSHITLIIGGDSYAQLTQWYQYTQLLELVDIAVAGRSNFSLQQYHYPCVTHVLHMENVQLSSTDIRLRVQYDLDISSRVMPDVAQYIADNNLYTNYRHITNKLQQMIKPNRYLHTYNVARTALTLAGNQQYDKVFLASTLHDCAKSCYVDYRHLSSENDDIAHAHIGAVVAQQIFGVQDADVLQAIHYHTTARADMSWLEKIVFLADKLEPARNYDTGCLYRNTLDETLLATLEDLVYFLELEGKTVHSLTREAIVYYNNVINKGKG